MPRLHRFLPFLVVLLTLGLAASAQDVTPGFDGGWQGVLKGKAYDLTGEGSDEHFQESVVMDIEKELEIERDFVLGRLVLIVDPDGDGPFQIGFDSSPGDRHLAAFYDPMDGTTIHPEWGNVLAGYVTAHGNRKMNRLKMSGFVLFDDHSVEFKAKFKRSTTPVLPD